VNLPREVRQRLAEQPRSGGALIEQIPVRKDAVLVYGVLARAKGLEVLAEGPGERIWGEPGARAKAPKAPGPPESFRMGDDDLARIERAVWAMTEGLPSFYFEELRRAAVARADRLAYEGEKRAADRALAELGPPASARRFLQAVEKGKRPRLRLSARRARRALVGLAIAVAIAAALRWFVVGFYRLPEGQISMAPALVPGVEGGDDVILAALRWFVVGFYRLPEGQISMAPALVPGVEGGDDVILANLLAYRIGRPERGEVAVFEAAGQQEVYVKRVMGLPGEVVEIRDGDLWIDGARLVKSNAFLDRVAVPLFGMEGFERTGDGYRQVERAHTGFRLPGGSVERRDAAAADVILEGAVRLEDLQDSVTLLARAGGKVRFHVVLNAVGYGAGVFVGNRTIARGQPCKLEPGRPTRFWLTNADRVLRLRLDGEEIARAEIDGPAGETRFEIVGHGVAELEVSRDLVYVVPPGAPDRWTLGKNAWFVLGDNSPVSRDSRTLGAIPGDALRGRVWRVIWPIDRARAVR